MTTPQDIDRLSAYLDGQLSPSEKAKLESRLAQEPDLKAALADLRMTVRALRALPAVKPPRSFTLSPAQVRHRPRVIFPGLRLAAVVSAVALAVVLAGDFASSLSFRASPAAAPASDIVLTAEAQAVATQAPALALEGGLAPTATQSRTEAPQQLMGPTEAAAAGEPGTPVPETDAAIPPSTPSPELEEHLRPTPEPTRESADKSGAGERAMAVPTGTPEAVGYAGAPPPATPELAYPFAQPLLAPDVSGVAPVRVLEVGLAALTLLLGLAAWLTRRT